jgi:hypothetical protein
MSELIVVGFKKDKYRAAELLNTLQDSNSSWAVDLNDEQRAKVEETLHAR